MNIITRNIPNSITCLNALSGCVAIVSAFSAFESFGALAGWQWACIAIGIAAVADFLDGFMARLLKAWSAIGKELDSLSDLVSFGVAPAMLLLNLLRADAQAPAWLPWCALIIPVLGALRLARFNVDDRQATSFIGLPIPANAIFWIGYAGLYCLTPEWQWLRNPAFLVPLILIEAWLMVSPIALFSLKFHNYGWRGNQCRWILILVSLVLIILLGILSFIPIIIFYIILSLIDQSHKSIVS